MSHFRVRSIISSCLTFLLLFNNAQAEPPRESDKLKILIVGDSITAGMYFLNLSNRSAAQGWASQLLLALGIEPNVPGLKNFYPTDNLELTKKGFGFWGIRNIKELLPNLFVHVEPVSGQQIAAIPGQTMNEALNQSSKNHGKRSASWIFGRLMLSDNESFVESIERSDSTYDWIIVWLGSNDLLSSFGIIGDAIPPEADEFKADYQLLIMKLSAKFKSESDRNHLLLLTLPDVTKLPMLVPLPEGAIDADGNSFPEGTKTNSFLSEYREKTFESSEVFRPEVLRDIQERVKSYNGAIREVAEEFGGAIVDIHSLLKNLENSMEYISSPYSYFSPDLHHPSFKLHSLIMKEVLKMMEENSDEKLPVDQERAENIEQILPSAAELTPSERKRANSLMRTNLLMMQDSRFPPRPAYRTAIETGVRSLNEFTPLIAFSGGIGFSSVPIASGWVSRFVVSSRLGLNYGAKRKTNENIDFSVGYAIEPQGRWDWRRFELGLSVSAHKGWGLYSKIEWRQIYFKTTNLFTSDMAIEGGFRLGKLWGRTGHNGN